MEKEFQKLLKTIESYNEKADLIKIRKAWKFAKMAHTGQKRFTGDPFASHVLAVAVILSEWKLDMASIVAGLLHDSVEDGGAKPEDITGQFGADVARIVDGVTKVHKVKLKGKKDEDFVENLRKMFLVMAKDLRVVLVRLADRLHNMKTLYALPKEKQIKKAHETLEVFAPLAERLGMGEVKAELDDLAFPYIYPNEYERVKNESAIHYKKAEFYIRKMKKNLLKNLAKEGIKAKISGRKKHLYSLWKKLERTEINWDFNKIYDIVALRILVNSTPFCYTALGITHSIYKPVPHLGVSDFIAQPKPNGYQSIHTKVFGPNGRIVEVQIRTKKMHKQAEYGIAAHWGYSEAKAKGVSDKILGEKGVFIQQNKLSWVKQLAEWQKEITDSEEFLKAVKFDALKGRIFVFSPKGDVYELPSSATPVDFAYAVHTDLGKYIKGAKVDGKVVTLDFKLQSGSVVEIIKSKNPHPPYTKWLDFIVTQRAKSKISKYLRKSE
ncbi:hypothetical protein A2Z22_01610 [Candidatus Woesebacteria bacterium RBG_16_34_12]|uniref:TGS domain-containing protein n=1 Tax=Candidatus Woesebacteria bacterium RBG_16_34_12 TaxID=1802480 RepID=A0A1F7XA62_9BACT|nr:MAG: hypothetical protein A2Z22_01610 [Candidatus Woesebacteria bacterium RBG_16_34_12]